MTLGFVLLAFIIGQGAASTPPPATSDIRGFVRHSADFCTAGQPRPEHFALLKAEGVKTVINLRTATEYKIDEEVAAVQAAGLKYFHVPVPYMAPTAEQADEFLKITDDPANRPVFIHCTAAIRAAAFWLIRRVKRDHWTWDDALAEARKSGLVNAPHLETFAKTYLGIK